MEHGLNILALQLLIWVHSTLSFNGIKAELLLEFVLKVYFLSLFL